jgi:hypothetical protein
MIEGSGFVPLTNGSRSRRPKHIRILIQIHNTGVYDLRWFNADPDSAIYLNSHLGFAFELEENNYFYSSPFKF